MLDVETLQSSTDVIFTGCDEDSLMTDSSAMISSTATTQDFDLVKNILSEIFDKGDEENLEERSPTEEKTTDLIPIEQHDELFNPLPTTTTNEEEDFRFLDQMLASIDGSDNEIHQLTPDEIDRVDCLLKDIVQNQQPESIDEEILPTEQEEPSILPTSIVDSLPIDEELTRVEQEWSRLTEDEKQLGTIAPEWVNDDQAPVCMKCGAKFIITRRRHHCRACGKVFCATCCSQKVKLIHDDNREDRACNDCVRIINRGLKK